MGVVYLPVTQNGKTTLVAVQDVAFQTETVLAGSGVYTSPIITNENARRLTGTCFANQSGSFVIQGSDDGTNWTPLASSTAVSASTLVTYDQILYNALTRAVYTNGGTANTVFRFFGYTNQFAG
jgi:hypothetical protein